MLKLKQIIPQEFCLRCLGCCRFIEKKSPWVPRIAKSEIMPIMLCKVNKNGYQLNLKKVKEINFCAFFDCQTNKCQIYLNRPFDCRIYPFVLERRRKSLFLSLHLSCPFAKENLNKKAFKDYLKYIKEYIQEKAVLRFIQKNPFLVGIYSPYRKELKKICVLK